MSLETELKKSQVRTCPQRASPPLGVAGVNLTLKNVGCLARWPWPAMWGQESSQWLYEICLLLSHPRSGHIHWETCSEGRWPLTWPQLWSIMFGLWSLSESLVPHRTPLRSPRLPHCSPLRWLLSTTCWLVAASVHRELKTHELALAKHIKLVGGQLLCHSVAVGEMGVMFGQEGLHPSVHTPVSVILFDLFKMAALRLQLPLYRLGLVWREWGTGSAKLKKMPGQPLQDPESELHHQLVP